MNRLTIAAAAAGAGLLLLSACGHKEAPVAAKTESTAPAVSVKVTRAAAVSWPE